MAGKGPSRNPDPVGDLAARILDPVLRKRAGISTAMIQSWEEIVGTRLAQSTRPEKLNWPRRMNEDDPFEPAVLVIACEGAAALRLQHEAGEVVARVNAFLGFNAVARIRIVQKPVAPQAPARPRGPRPLTRSEASALAGRVGAIEDEGLRASLERLGASVIGSRKA